MPTFFDRVNANDPDFDHMQRIVNLLKYKFIGRLLNENDVVLEVACGIGYNAKHLAGIVRHVTAIDSDEKTIQENRERYVADNLDFRVMDALNLEFPHDIFDAVVCVDLLEHLNKKDGLKLLKELTRVLVPQGTLFLTTPRRIPKSKRSKNRLDSHIHEYSFKELKNVLERFFHRVMIFTRSDEIIYTGHPDLAWAFLAVCCGVK